jgi:hypothetical protein
MEKFKVEIIRHGHEFAEMTVQELESMQDQGFIVAAQIGNALQMLQKLDEAVLRRATRIIVNRVVMGG